jgi:hypothetical protein
MQYSKHYSSAKLLFLKNLRRSSSLAFLSFIANAPSSCPPAKSYVPIVAPRKAHMPIALGSDPVRIPLTNPAAQPAAAPESPSVDDSWMLATVWSTQEKTKPAVAKERGFASVELVCPRGVMGTYQSIQRSIQS